MAQSREVARRKPWLGIIADDVTGATDVGGHLAALGLSVVQFFGCPGSKWADIGADSTIIALKSRSVEPTLAVKWSLQALQWLKRVDVEHVYFKYCSTFDSTSRGNIGPVLDALSDALEAGPVLVAPAAPRNGRTVYMSKLFVWAQLLSESPMKSHPLNPMLDPDLRALLRQQTSRRTGALYWQQLQRLRDLGELELAKAEVSWDPGTGPSEGAGYVVADAITEEDLEPLGAIALKSPLSSGSAGLAVGIARARGHGKDARSVRLSLPKGPSAVLAGSCSAATREQVSRFSRRHPSFFVDPRAVARGEDVLGGAVALALEHFGRETPLIYSTASPDEVAIAQDELGVERAASLVEEVMSAIAVKLVGHGVRRLVVAGGETAGAVVSALGVEGVWIGEEVDPGVPWTVTLGEPRTSLLLKSGNFGSPDIFEKATTWA
jgi:uncharacterized protein YgbK (DUF1537 family)